MTTLPESPWSDAWKRYQDGDSVTDTELEGMITEIQTVLAHAGARRDLFGTALYSYLIGDLVSLEGYQRSRLRKR